MRGSKVKFNVLMNLFPSWVPMKVEEQLQVSNLGLNVVSYHLFDALSERFFCAIQKDKFDAILNQKHQQSGMN